MQNITRFHKDLKTYTDVQIRLMAKHNGLTGRPDDLRWILAIKHSHIKAQMPVDFLSQFPPLESLVVDGELTLDELLNLRYVSSMHKKFIDLYLERFVKGLKTVNNDTLMKYIQKPRLTHLDLLVIKGLVENPRVDKSYDSNKALMKAIEYGHIDVVRLLLSDQSLDLSNDINLALIVACEWGHIDIVRLLLEDERIDPSYNDNEAIYRAIEFGNTDIVRLLFGDNRVDLSDVGNAALIVASGYGYTDIVRLLLSDIRVNPSGANNRAIEEASRNGHIDVVNLLLTDPRVRASYSHS